MLDYLELEGDLTGEEKLVRDEARRFVDEQVKPDIGEHYEAGTFPTDLIPKMGDLGFYAPNLDGYGLPGLGERAYGLLMQELEAGDSGLRSMASVQGSLVIYPIHAYGSDEQKQRWLPKLGSGEAVGCFGLTEPQHGSDPSGMETRAERDADGYVLNGSKTWITNSPIADVAVVWARDVSAEGSPVRGFLVETDRDGVTTNKIEGKLSMRASVTGEIGLDDVRVPEEDVLPGVEGMNGPLSCLTQARFGIAWGVVGAARDAFEDARQYAKDRDQFGGPIARFQLQQGKLAEMATQITNAQLMAHRLTDLKERGDLRHQQVSMAKRHNVRVAREVTRTAREMLGGNGITTDYSPMRHMENIETVYTYEGTDDIHTLVLGADLTGIEAFH
ncbi:acyl-CoA dehydrogenase family protein [Haloferax volcanii]|uniref:glutaryl-CoA dehydrogenase (ETF) n=3 Tax=Haloferax volcanii TaxID=2246 RepID=A0A384LFP3_HALVD|nr:acyl-CoA dehydrogenase family protein [Haloferax volcanii]ADE03487.1 glutaryl-CoA dehydrogenase [Haloferax volcanii DS2]ELY23901.1 acyl-CoA dehydrogenase [Haloferax volcanii DS2]MBS8118620.1 acyl-CoA dehydrogenase family protein [Haloferax volcanii]MBS8123634.1 acyl-CoA dehydrogenase family protein [Haloferax volcanii]MBS8127503.1 acyl-CoA dehydrogenase family protein [Haloferax volcanii]